MTDDDFAELFKSLPPRGSGGTSWRDVAAEFETLGKTFGDVLRTAWQRSESEPFVSQMRESIEDAIGRLDRAAADNAETREARDQLMGLVDTIRTAAERAGEDLRPELIDLLRRANSELQRFKQ